MSPGVWPHHQNGRNDTNLYNVGESLIIIEKTHVRRRHKSQPRNASVSTVDNGHSREKRNPLLDRVKHTRLSCFRSSTSSQVDVPSASSSSVPNKYCETNSASLNSNALQDANLDNFNNSCQNAELIEICTSENPSIYDSLPRSSCLTAKLRAMSERYLQSSTNRFLSKLYKNHEPSLAESIPTKLSDKKNITRAKLRSFSYGTLPGLDEFQKKHNPLFREDDTQILDDEEERALLMDQDDTDSGILLNDSGSSSILENDPSRCASALSSPLVEARNLNIHNDGNHFPSKYESTRKTLSLDKYDIARFRCPKTPTLPAKASPRQKKCVLLVRLVKTTPVEELGILIVKSRVPGYSGYVIANLLLNGAAER